MLRESSGREQEACSECARSTDAHKGEGEGGATQTEGSKWDTTRGREEEQALPSYEIPSIQAGIGKRGRVIGKDVRFSAGVLLK